MQKAASTEIKLDPNALLLMYGRLLGTAAADALKIGKPTDWGRIGSVD